MFPRHCLFLIATLGALAASPASAATVDVVIPVGQNVFYPRTVVINVGDTVRWTNQDPGMSHTATSDLGPGTTFDLDLSTITPQLSHQFDGAGIFPYHCTPHQSVGMRGIVIVNGSNRKARASNEIAVTLGAWNFEGAESGTLTGAVAGDMRNVTAGAHLRTSVSLPQGALITGLELSGCDTATGSITAELRECIEPPVTAGVCNVVATAALNGDICGFDSSSEDPLPVDNFGYTYVVEVTLPVGGGSFRSVRVFYKKQISPPPVAATFGDVPTNHAFFPFVEALVKAGITSGCGAGTYCPDNAVTRGQMAVFLSRLGGLFWPN